MVPVVHGVRVLGEGVMYIERFDPPALFPKCPHGRLDGGLIAPNPCLRNVRSPSVMVTHGERFQPACRVPSDQDEPITSLRNV